MRDRTRGKGKLRPANSNMLIPQPEDPKISRTHPTCDRRIWASLHALPTEEEFHNDCNIWKRFAAMDIIFETKKGT